MRRIEALAARLAASGALGLAAAFGLTGCCYYELRDMVDECTMNTRNCYAARCAWHRCGGDYDGPHGRAYKDGFIDGYSAVAGGSDGCPPSMPPRCYWSCCETSCDEVAAYFNGYSRGAVCAEKDGVAGCSRIAFRKPACGAVCPVPGYGVGPGALTPAPAGVVSLPAMPPGPVGAGSPPPPAPPSVSPAAPADEAYEGYSEGGLYYE